MTTRSRSVPKLGRTLRSLAIVEVQHPAEPLAARNSAHIRRLASRPLDQPVVETLVIPFQMVVLDVLGDGETEMALTERNDLR